VKTSLLQLDQRIKELESLADEVSKLVKQWGTGKAVEWDLNTKGERWYRGARELLVQQKYSGLEDFDNCYHSGVKDVIAASVSISDQDRPSACQWFLERAFRQARSLLAAVEEEVKSRELPVKSRLSFEVAADEFERASELLSAAAGDEVLVRAGGVVARVAIERHLFTVAETHHITVEINPPHKKKAEAQDVINTLAKHNVITAIQKSELEHLFKIGNFCAHPKEPITEKQVETLITRGHELASVIL
jgi:hypothetical protein